MSRGAFPDSSVGKESTCNAGNPNSIPGLGRSAGEGLGHPLRYSWASLVTLLVKNLPACERPGFDSWFGKIPWRRKRLPTPVFWPGEFHGLYSPWGLKELDMTFIFIFHKYLGNSIVTTYFLKTHTPLHNLHNLICITILT